MLTLEYQAQFKRDMRTILRRGWDIAPLQEIVEMLQMGAELPERCRDHPLHGGWADYRDCHIKGDWVLIYRISKEQGTLRLVRTGTHVDLGLGH